MMSPEEKKAYMKDWRVRNREKCLEANRRYREANRAKLAEANRVRYATVQKAKDSCARYQRENRQLLNQRKNDYYRRNRERVIERQKEYYRQNKEALNAQRTEARYGISAEELDRRRAEQGGGCAICGAVEPVLHIDHCHATGAVRGLLCGHCNKGIGFLKDSPEILQRAIGYLKGYDGDEQ